MGRATTKHPALQGLTEKRRRFVLAYVQSGNATDAARQAGYAKPHPEGTQLLQNPTVQAALSALTAPAERKAIASTEEIHERLSAILRGEVKAASRTESETGVSVAEREPTPAEMAAAAKLLLTARGELVKRVERVEHAGSKDELIARLEATLAKLKGSHD